MGRNATIRAATSYCGCVLPVHSPSVALCVGVNRCCSNIQRRLRPTICADARFIDATLHSRKSKPFGFERSCRWVDCSVFDSTQRNPTSTSLARSLSLSPMHMKHRLVPATANRSSEHKQRRLGGCGERSYISLGIWQHHIGRITNGCSQRARAGLESPKPPSLREMN